MSVESEFLFESVWMVVGLDVCECDCWLFGLVVGFIYSDVLSVDSVAG